MSGGEDEGFAILGAEAAVGGGADGGEHGEAVIERDMEGATAHGDAFIEGDEVEVGSLDEARDLGGCEFGFYEHVEAVEVFAGVGFVVAKREDERFAVGVGDFFVGGADEVEHFGFVGAAEEADDEVIGVDAEFSADGGAVCGNGGDGGPDGDVISFASANEPAEVVDPEFCGEDDGIGVGGDATELVEVVEAVNNAPDAVYGEDAFMDDGGDGGAWAVFADTAEEAVKVGVEAVEAAIGEGFVLEDEVVWLELGDGGDGLEDGGRCAIENGMERAGSCGFFLGVGADDVDVIVIAEGFNEA